MTEKKWAYEDMALGRVISLGARTVAGEEIAAFAQAFDPQPMHIDEKAAKAGLLGGLAASGWHVCALMMRMMCDAFVLDSTSQGAPGMDYVRWKKPVFAGDVLSGELKVVARRRSASRRNLGLVTYRSELRNQHGEAVLEAASTSMFLLRDPEAVA